MDDYSKAFGAHIRLLRQRQGLSQEDRDPAASGIDGLKVVQVTVGMVESASTGRTVKLEPLPV